GRLEQRGELGGEGEVPVEGAALAGQRRRRHHLETLLARDFGQARAFGNAVLQPVDERRKGFVSLVRADRGRDLVAHALQRSRRRAVDRGDLDYVIAERAAHRADQRTLRRAEG